MLLVLPIPGVEVGPAWASELITALGSLVDAHDHSANKGVKITPSGLNITSDLDLKGSGANTNNLKNFRALRTTNVGGTLGTAADWGAIYRNGNELYFTDGAGNIVQITLNGALNVALGNITGMAGGAAVTYNNGTKTYVFTQSANKAAAIQAGDVVVTDESVAPGNGITLHAAAGLAAPFTITLPTALPAGTAMPVTLDSAGNLVTETAGLQIKAVALAAAITPAGGDLTIYVDTTTKKLSIKTVGGMGMPIAGGRKNTGSPAGFNTVETVILGGINSGGNAPDQSFRIPANTLEVGSMLHCRIRGGCTNTNPDNVTVRLRIGTNGTTADGAKVTFNTFASGANGTNIQFEIDIWLRCNAVGAAATFEATAGAMRILNFGTTGINAAAVSFVNVSSVATFDSTADNYAEITGQVAAATTTISIAAGSMELV